MFMCNEQGIQPDIMTVSKALGGGVVPVGATLATASAYSEKFALKHSSTFAEMRWPPEPHSRRSTC